jgi:hypothetical protein
LLYHVADLDNLPSILKRGLISGYKSEGMMATKDGNTYLTNSLKYIGIMANDIAKWKNYVILQVDIDMDKLQLIWWKGKKYKEWTTKDAIPPNKIKVYQICIEKG